MIKTIFAFALIPLGLVSLFLSVLTFAVKAQKYGLADLWQNPDAFAIICLLIALFCFAGSLYLFKNR